MSLRGRLRRDPLPTTSSLSSSSSSISIRIRRRRWHDVEIIEPSFVFCRISSSPHECRGSPPYPPFSHPPQLSSVFSSESVYGDVREDISITKIRNGRYGGGGGGSNFIVVVVGCVHDGWCSFGCCCCH